MRSIYYWSTTFRMDSTKVDFIKTHRIQRLYIRYFDVVNHPQKGLVPNATVVFESEIPQALEIVPTIFIVNGCMDENLRGLADKILKRVLQMNETHDILNVKEIQIDCDWTLRTRKKYFDFLGELRQLAKQHGIGLSATIRLHQLSHPEPPVDKGVLMMYNTGDFTDINCHHPILDMKDAAPYLKDLKSYELPLSSAYPLYRWKILFRNKNYKGIIHQEGELPVLPGDSIVIRQPGMQEIMAAKAAVSGCKAEANREIILFDLTQFNITRFHPNDYEKIFNQ